jgi:hypothetical protein
VSSKLVDDTRNFRWLQELIKSGLRFNDPG